ncbi:phosphoserine phosphatase isoform X2 [Condylostylus longicornis]|nr:phosphoserine phosphatase isoform X2 [Condylostylus longicornis]
MPNQDIVKRLDQASAIIKNSDIVCFDVDSTVIKEEGIDELAKFCGKGPQVALLTQSAMGGSMTFQDALRIRLDIIRPSQKQIREFLKLHPSTLSPGIKEFINNLRKNGTSVYLISGGFDCLIEPVADELGVPMKNVFANKLMFYFDGEYAGFDTNQPTSRSGGKGEAISIIRKTINSDANITMIGDGATDLEASPPANHFIGYGGNVVRSEVQARSDYYITDFSQIF